MFHWPGKNELEVLDAGDHQYEVRGVSRLAWQLVRGVTGGTLHAR